MLENEVVSDDSSLTDNSVKLLLKPVGTLPCNAPAKNEVPPVTLRPAPAVIKPTESTLVTSSYVKTPPTFTIASDCCNIFVS